jgi:hypothetical protein
MRDTRALLERAALSAPEARLDIDDLASRRRRLRTRDRVLAIGTALVLTLGAAGFAYLSLRSAETSRLGSTGPTGPTAPEEVPADGLPRAERAPLIASPDGYYVHRVHMYRFCPERDDATGCDASELLATWWWSPADDSGRIDVEIANAYGIDEGRFGPGEFPNNNGIDVADFPTEPRALHDFLLARSQPGGQSPAPLVSPPPGGAPEDGRLWRAITDLLEDPHVTPAVRASLLQVAANLQGSDVTLDVTDPVGRPAHVISLELGDSGWVQRLYVDPASHEFLASASFEPGSDVPHWIWLVETAGVAESVEDLPTEPSIPNGAEA